MIHLIPKGKFVCTIQQYLAQQAHLKQIQHFYILLLYIFLFHSFTADIINSINIPLPTVDRFLNLSKKCSRSF